MKARLKSLVPTRRPLYAAAAVLIGVVAFCFGGSLYELKIVSNGQPAPAANHSRALSANDLRPQACVTDNLSVAKVITGKTGTSLTGDNTNELLLAGSATTSITGGAGNDCIVGGPGISIDGGSGKNTCIGDVTKMTNCADKVAG